MACFCTLFGFALSMLVHMLYYFLGALNTAWNEVKKSGMFQTVCLENLEKSNGFFEKCPENTISLLIKYCFRIMLEEQI